WCIKRSPWISKLLWAFKVAIAQGSWGVDAKCRPVRRNTETGRVLQGFFADMVASTRASIETLKDRLRRTTLRERVLLGGLVLGAALYAPVAALDWRTTQADRYIDALTEQSAARL